MGVWMLRGGFAGRDFPQTAALAAWRSAEEAGSGRCRASAGTAGARCLGSLARSPHSPGPRTGQEKTPPPHRPPTAACEAGRLCRERTGSARQQKFAWEPPRGRGAPETKRKQYQTRSPGACPLQGRNRRRSFNPAAGRARRPRSAEPGGHRHRAALHAGCRGRAAPAGGGRAGSPHPAPQRPATAQRPSPAPSSRGAGAAPHRTRAVPGHDAPRPPGHRRAPAGSGRRPRGRALSPGTGLSGTHLAPGCSTWKAARTGRQAASPTGCAPPGAPSSAASSSSAPPLPDILPGHRGAPLQLARKHPRRAGLRWDRAAAERSSAPRLARRSRSTGTGTGTGSARPAPARPSRAPIGRCPAGPRADWCPPRYRQTCPARGTAPALIGSAPPRPAPRHRCPARVPRCGPGASGTGPVTLPARGRCAPQRCWQGPLRPGSAGPRRRRRPRSPCSEAPARAGPAFCAAPGEHPTWASKGGCAPLPFDRAAP